MEVTFHGVRGSTPCHGEEIAGYGGNTSCVSLAIPGEDPILFDLGTGLRYFGQTQPADKAFTGTCLLSHLHWDHIQGLPFFKPFLRPGANVALYAPAQPDGTTVAEVFGDTIKPPLFPIHFSMLPGMLDIHEIADDDFMVGGAKVMSRLIPHVGATLGYRVEWNGRSVVYISDHQMPSDGSHSAWPNALELCAGADLLIHDAQYTPEEFAMKRDWGHCTPEFAVWLAATAGVKRLALFHHDPAHVDDDLDAILAPVIACAASHGVDAFAARERVTIAV
jgi:phosphoribosyl 1,2-cyclic phosphodiesterase